MQCRRNYTWKDSLTDHLFFIPAMIFIYYDNVHRNVGIVTLNYIYSGGKHKYIRSIVLLMIDSRDKEVIKTIQAKT